MENPFPQQTEGPRTVAEAVEERKQVRQRRHRALDGVRAVPASTASLAHEPRRPASTPLALLRVSPERSRRRNSTRHSCAER